MRIVCTNRKARHDYDIIETYEAGIVLKGTEVKALREGRANLKDSFAKIKNGEIFLLNSHISPYTYGNVNNHDPERERKLLMHKREIVRLTGKVKEKGYTLVPLSIYFDKNNRVKVELALAKGKSKYDKRESIKRRDEKRIEEYERKYG